MLNGVKVYRLMQAVLTGGVRRREERALRERGSRLLLQETDERVAKKLAEAERKLA